MTKYGLCVRIAFISAITFTLSSTSAFAGSPEGASVIASNIIESSTNLPSFIAALSYLLGIFFGIMGIVKLKSHVENPSQTPLGQSVVRLVAGGALFALPIVIEAAFNTFSPDGTTLAAGPLQGELDNLSSLSIGGISLGGTTDPNDVAENLIDSASLLPNLISAFAYLIGLLLVVTGILKIKEYVDAGQPQGAALRAGIIRLLIAGALFALPVIYDALAMTIHGGSNDLDIDNNSTIDFLSGLMGAVSGLLGFLFMDLNVILANIIEAINQVPRVISAVAYLSGLLMAVQGLLKVKDHVENPDQTPLKEGVIRLLIAGALFSMPTIYNITLASVMGGSSLPGVLGVITGLLGAVSFFESSLAPNDCLEVIGNEGVGERLCMTIVHTSYMPAFLGSISYLIGLVLGLWGVFKIRDHVLNPQQTGLWEGVSRLLAGGLFFAMPMVVEIARNTVMPTVMLIPGLVGLNYNPAINNLSCDPAAGSLGLDGIFGCFMADVMGPLHVLVNFFAFVAGMILIMIGTSRLIKSAQDGARGPGGLGTIMTFAMGAALISYNEMLSAASATFMGDSTPAVNGVLSYTQGMTVAEVEAAHVVITSIIQFMILIGLISFVRGLFIVRSVAEGNQQASIMAGMTHIIGGALAVNLGPLINAVQVSLGIQGFGLAFS